MRTRWLSALVSVRTACTHDERRSLPPSELVSSIELMIDMIIVGSQSSSTERSSTVLPPRHTWAASAALSCHALPLLMLMPAAGRRASTLEEGSSLSRHRIVQLATVRTFLPVARPAMRRVMWHNSCCWIVLSLLLAVLLRPFVRTEIVVAAADGVVGSRRICLRQLRGPNLQPMVLWLCVIYSLSVYFNLFRTNGYAIQYPYVYCIPNQRTGLPGCCVC